MSSWISTSFSAVLMVALSAAGIYLALMILTRLVGLRSFAKLSSFDFAVTVAIGSAVATTIMTDDPPLLQATVGLASLYGLQALVAVARERWPAARRVMDNEPILLMDGDRVLWDNMRVAHVTEDDLRGKLREANVLHPREIRAVVMESTGDVSVLHGDPDGAELHPSLLDGVRGA